MTFKELGVDQLFVDEADLYKNLAYATKMSRIAGLPNSDSNRAFDMFLKIRYLQERGEPTARSKVTKPCMRFGRGKPGGWASVRLSANSISSQGCSRLQSDATPTSCLSCALARKLQHCPLRRQTRCVPRHTPKGLGAPPGRVVATTRRNAHRMNFRLTSLKLSLILCNEWLPSPAVKPRACWD